MINEIPLDEYLTSLNQGNEQALASLFTGDEELHSEPMSLEEVGY